MGDFPYSGGGGDPVTINERLGSLLLRMEKLKEEESTFSLEKESLTDELDQWVKTLEDIKEEMKAVENISEKTQDLLARIRFLIQQYHMHIVQSSYQSLLSATNTLQTLSL